MTATRIALAVVVIAAAAPAGAEPADGGSEQFYFRAGPLLIIPLETSDEIVLSNVDGAASLAVDNGPLSGSEAGVESVLIGAVTFGYVLPWLDGRLSIETILGLPFTIEFEAEGDLAEESIAPDAMGIPTGVPPLGSELGETKAVPPVVTAVYRFSPQLGVTPYAGAGLSYLIAYDEKITNPILTEVNEPEFDVENNLGYVAQAGLETRIWNRLYVNLDIKFVAGLSTRGVARNIHVKAPGLPLFDTVRVGDANMRVRVNPFIVHLGTGMNF